MPIATATYPFRIDGQFLPVFSGKRPRHWHDAADHHGFTIIGCAVDRLHVVLACKTCGEPHLKRVSVLLGHTPECPHCIRKRREAAAAEVGARLIGPDPKKDRHFGLYQFACGHSGRRQHTCVEAAAAGGHNLGCEICLNDHHTAEAEAQDWQLVGPPARRNPSYRR